MGLNEISVDEMKYDMVVLFAIIEVFDKMCFCECFLCLVAQKVVKCNFMKGVEEVMWGEQ